VQLPAASLAEFANIADSRFRLEMMHKCVLAVRDAGDLHYPLLNLISVFIDGLVAAPKGQARAMYSQYLKTHFPSLCRALPAEVFYEHYRCKAVHEFGLGTGFAIGRDSGLKGEYVARQNVRELGQTVTILNIDRFALDFLAHVEFLIQRLGD
jgi:hypothetical protein